MTTGTHRLTAPAVRTHGAGSRVFRRLRGGLAAGVKRIQYARQMEALAQMPNHQLAEIGLRRSEIPAYAWRLIYGSG